jgi:hypothetical protein
VANGTQFKFYHPAEAREHIAQSWSNRVSDEMLTFHSDPFFAECRAYGRISQYYNEAEKTGNGKSEIKQRNKPPRKIKEMAAPCYGYIAVPADPYETLLRNKFGVTSWNRSDDDAKKPETNRQPFRALIKKFIDSPRSVVRPGKMLRDLKLMRSIGIYPRDIFARNYKDGLLVDFSIAWTQPHWFLGFLGKGQFQIKTDNELHLFDEMIEQSDVKTNVRAFPSLKYLKMLRGKT